MERTMSSTGKPKDWPGRTIDLAVFAADLERRRAETGITDVSRNSGTRRTAYKKALLKAIKDAGGDW
jgi:hypothetical protein